MTSTVDGDRTSRNYSDVVSVFEPHALTLPPLRSYMRDLLNRRTFLTELAKAQIRGQRSSTVMGELWALLDPVFQAAIYWFLFVVIRGGRAGGTSQYLTIIVGSVFLFNFSRISISDGGRAILRNKGLVMNSMFPRALLPAAEVYKGFLETLPALAIFALFTLPSGRLINQGLLLFPLLMLIQTVVNMGLALLLSTATVLIKDMSNLINYILRILTFATPVVYPVSALTPQMTRLLQWNPLFALFSAYQSIIDGKVPSASLIIQASVWAVVYFVLGAWLFLRHERSFALHV